MRLLPFDYAVRNLGRSRVRLSLSLAGSFLVVLLVLSAGAFVRGMSKSLRVSGSEHNVILLGAGSEESFERSEIHPTVPGLALSSIPGIKQRLGVGYLSPEVFFMTMLKGTGTDSEGYQVMLRGVTPAAFLVHSQARIVEGRLGDSGRDEIIVGALAATKMGVPEDRLSIGNSLVFDNRAWTIVGRFEAPGTVMESEVWVPLSDLQIAAKRDNLSCVVLTLDHRAEFDDVDAFAKTRLDLELVALRESDYYAKLHNFFRPIEAMVWATAILIASGGFLGGLNTMYAAFASRVREIGSLQAIGFSRAAIVLSLVQESLLASAAGSLLASATAVLLLQGFTIHFSMGVFGLIVDAAVLLTGLTAGLILGLGGALPPAWRCLRLPVNEALNAV